MMKLFLLLIVSFIFVGCRSYHYVRTAPTGERHEIWITTFATDSALGKLKILTPEGDVLLEGYSTKVNDKTIKAISEGVTAAVLKSAVPLP